MVSTSLIRERPIQAIVIGGSAGAIGALSVILPYLDREIAVPVVVVVHLPTQRPSLLVDVFGPRCSLVVREAEDKVPLAPGHVYFAPPDYHLLVEKDRHAALSVDAPVHFSRPSIDVLFESAADVYRDSLAAVVLTGASNDGAAGLAAVAKHGGLTIVQTVESAESPEMPAAALEAVTADHVLPPEQIAGLLSAVVRLSKEQRR